MHAFTQASAAQVLPPGEYFFMSGAVHSMVLNGACQTFPMTPVCVEVTATMFGRSSHIPSGDFR
jgi:hypothetical protein